MDGRTFSMSCFSWSWSGGWKNWENCLSYFEYVAILWNLKLFYIMKVTLAYARLPSTVLGMVCFSIGRTEGQTMMFGKSLTWFSGMYYVNECFLFRYQCDYNGTVFLEPCPEDGLNLTYHNHHLIILIIIITTTRMVWVQLHLSRTFWHRHLGTLQLCFKPRLWQVSQSSFSKQ